MTDNKLNLQSSAKNDVVSQNEITTNREFSVEEYSIMELEDRLELALRCNISCDEN